MSLEIFKVGKDVELEALGAINKNKEKELSQKYLFNDAIQRMYPGKRIDTVKQFLAAHPEESERVQKEVFREFNRLFVENPHLFVYNEEVALKIAKESQPRNRAELADDLYNVIGEELGLEDRDDEEDLVDLKYYTAVNSKLDMSFGIDCFFTYTHTDKETGKKQEVIVSIDVTTNPDKVNYKSDLLLRFREDSAEKRSNWSQLVLEYGKIVADKFREKIAIIDQVKSN